MKDPYAPESETTALIKADTRTPAERELTRLMADAGDGEQGFDPEAALRHIALSLIAQLQDARTEVVALHATEQNLRDGIAPQEDRATPPAQPAPVPQGSIQHLKVMMEESAFEGRLDLSDALKNIDEFYTTPPAAQPAPVQEPVAWWIPKHKAPDMVSKVRWSDECEPLYTTPPTAQPAPEQYTALEQALTRLQKRHAELEAKVAAQPAVPLTDEQIMEAVRSTGLSFTAPDFKVARAIEAAHGITAAQG